MNNRWMFGISTLLLVAALGWFGCGGNDDDDNTPPTNDDDDPSQPNDDDDVDHDDFSIFQGCMSGANEPADPACAE